MGELEVPVVVFGQEAVDWDDLALSLGQPLLPRR